MFRYKAVGETLSDYVFFVHAITVKDPTFQPLLYEADSSRILFQSDQSIQELNVWCQTHHPHIRCHEDTISPPPSDLQWLFQFRFRLYKEKMISFLQLLVQQEANYEKLLFRRAVVVALLRPCAYMKWEEGISKIFRISYRQVPHLFRDEEEEEKTTRVSIKRVWINMIRCIQSDLQAATGIQRQPLVFTSTNSSDLRLLIRAEMTQCHMALAPCYRELDAVTFRDGLPLWKEHWFAPEAPREYGNWTSFHLQHIPYCPTRAPHRQRQPQSKFSWTYLREVRLHQPLERYLLLRRLLVHRWQDLLRLRDLATEFPDFPDKLPQERWPDYCKILNLPLSEIPVTRCMTAREWVEFLEPRWPASLLPLPVVRSFWMTVQQYISNEEAALVCKTRLEQEGGEKRTLAARIFLPTSPYTSYIKTELESWRSTYPGLYLQPNRILQRKMKLARLNFVSCFRPVEVICELHRLLDPLDLGTGRILRHKLQVVEEVPPPDPEETESDATEQEDVRPPASSSDVRVC